MAEKRAPSIAEKLEPSWRSVSDGIAGWLTKRSLS